jgi:hypothetical protein
MKEFIEKHYHFPNLQNLRTKADAIRFLKIQTKLKHYRQIKSSSILDSLSTADMKFYAKLVFGQLLDDRKELIQFLSKQQSQAVEDYDIFGNPIVKPVIGNDGEIYAVESMQKLFQKGRDGLYKNIPSQYVGGEYRPKYKILKNIPLTNYYHLSDFEHYRNDALKQKLQQYVNKMNN